ncbi:MAG: hypothetical protein AB7U45_15470 [Desulfamplus sp.]
MPEPNQSYQQQVFAFISSIIGQKNIIPVPIEFVHFVGDYNTAALLNQIIYWTDRTKDPYGWFYKSYADWYKELALSKYQVNRAAGVLKSMNLIETQVKKVNGDPTLHYRLDTDIFIDLFGKHLHGRNENNNPLQSAVSEVSSLTKVDKFNLPKFSSFTNIIITETTSKSTAETKPIVNSNSDIKQKSSPSPFFPKNIKKQKDTTPDLIIKPLSEIVIINGEEKIIFNTTTPLPEAFTSEHLDSVLKLIPEHHRQPIVTNLLKRYYNAFPLEYVQSGIKYTVDHSKGDTGKFKAYLGQALDFGWGDGYSAIAEKKAKQQKEQEILRQKQVEAMKVKQQEEQDRERESKEVAALMASTNITELDKFIETECWSNMNTVMKNLWKQGTRNTVRRLHLRKFIAANGIVDKSSPAAFPATVQPVPATSGGLTSVDFIIPEIIEELKQHPTA